LAQLTGLNVQLALAWDRGWLPEKKRCKLNISANTGPAVQLLTRDATAAEDSVISVFTDDSDSARAGRQRRQHHEPSGLKPANFDEHVLHMWKGVPGWHVSEIESDQTAGGWWRCCCSACCYACGGG
jgi:hypothetical protein